MSKHRVIVPFLTCEGKHYQHFIVMAFFTDIGIMYHGMKETKVLEYTGAYQEIIGDFLLVDFRAATVDISISFSF